jgi:hypothetical protein
MPRDQRQDLTRLRVHDDHDATLEIDDARRPLERLLGLALRLDVDGELE